MKNGYERAKQIGVIVLVALLAIAAWVKPLEAPASETLDATMKKAFVTFATARALNAGISLLQSGQVSVQAVGGVSFKPGEVLDPLNDLVEQFSSVMLAATVALGIQRILLAVGAYWVLPPLVAAVATIWILSSLSSADRRPGGSCNCSCCCSWFASRCRWPRWARRRCRSPS